jgi:DNA-directed RNA polymerase alpha subunit
MTHVVHITEELLELPIASLDLEVRLVNMLENQDIRTVLDLLRCCPRENDCHVCPVSSECTAKLRIRGIPNFGQASLDKVYLALEVEGIKRRSKRSEEQTTKTHNSRRNPFRD